MPETEFRDECRRWDDALLAHFVFEAAAGDRVFLSVYEEVLNRLGQGWERNSDDFLALVQRRWVRWVRRQGKKPRQEVILRLFDVPALGPEEYVTFLAAMVLAAHWMETEVKESAGPGGVSQVIDEKNYFKRLRQVLALELEDEQVRPRGLRDYEDAIVWRHWADWLEAKGRGATARLGRGGRRYINYPLSQTLLRDGDRSWLARRFWEDVRGGLLSRVYDPDMLIGWMDAHRGRFHRARLWQLLDQREQQLRYEATVAAVFDVYSSVDWDANLEEGGETTTGPIRRLTAGVYGEQDPFMGNVAYSMYLRQPRGQDGQGLKITWSGVEAAFRPERPGWFTLAFPSGQLPANSLTLEVVTPCTAIRAIIFPEKPFWVLVGDPRTVGTGVFATWALRPVPERPFVLLCRTHLQDVLEQLRGQQLVDWEGIPADLTNGGWLEYRGVQVHGAQWRIRINDFDEDAQALIKRIRPEPGGTIRLEGGLEAPDRQEGWMQDYLPQVIVEAPEGLAEVSLVNLQTRESGPGMRVRANEPLDLPALLPGFYRIEAVLVDGTKGGDRRHALPGVVLSVRSWGSLECAVLPAESD
jgi:hypothetical protein